jgi:hypothetical protein
VVKSVLSSAELSSSLHRLRAYVEREDFAGYDPYDALNSPLPFHLLGKWGPVLAIQVMKRLPLNIRPLLGIRKGHNPKALGLFLRAYALLHRHDPRDEYVTTMRHLVDLLESMRSTGYSGVCWGYNFSWANPAKQLKPFEPTVVATGFVAKGLSAAVEATGGATARDLLAGTTPFILDDIARTEDETGVCFSYTPVMRDCCYNASLLAAETLARAQALTAGQQWTPLITRAVDYVVARQKEDGHWNYSADPSTGRERAQIDFHQGFVLESLHEIARLTASENDALRVSLKRGLEYYIREQFTSDGRAYFRLPRQRPVDIHNQAQGIITCALLAERHSDAAATARNIASWTIRTMQQRSGAFSYRRHRFLTDRTQYMRWSQAWMMLALSMLMSIEQGSHRGHEG